MKNCLNCNSKLIGNLKIKKYCNEYCAIEIRGKMQEFYRKYLKRSCEKCGAINSDYETYSQDGLVVHHIDENVTNNKLENLITLCRTCHSKIHTKRVGQDLEFVYN